MVCPNAADPNFKINWELKSTLKYFKVYFKVYFNKLRIRLTESLFSTLAVHVRVAAIPEVAIGVGA